MRCVAFIPALMGLAAAVPYDDAADIEAAAKAAADRFDKRAASCKNTPATACTSQPGGYGPTVTPDTVANFLAYDGFSQTATLAVTPQNYVQTFQNLDGFSTASKFITYYNFESYDTNACAAKCNQVQGCIGFNIYFERDPTVSTHPTCCPNPASMTTIRCALWGSPVGPKNANNKGQYRNSFQVVIAGSNGYNKFGASSSSSSGSSGSSGSSSSSSTSNSSRSAGSTATPTMTADSKSATTASSVTQSSSAPTSSSGPSSSASYLSNTDNVQPVTGTQPGSPITATIATSSTTGCATPVATPAITFNLNKTTIYGENIFMYGSISQVGNWDVSNSYPLSSLHYTTDNTNWYATLEVTAGTSFEYKYFQRNIDYSITWANPPNMQYTVPTGCQEMIVVNDQWQ